MLHSSSKCTRFSPAKSVDPTPTGLVQTTPDAVPATVGAFAVICARERDGANVTSAHLTFVSLSDLLLPSRLPLTPTIPRPDLCTHTRSVCWPWACPASTSESKQNSWRKKGRQERVWLPRAQADNNSRPPCQSLLGGRWIVWLCDLFPGFANLRRGMRPLGAHGPVALYVYHSFRLRPGCVQGGHSLPNAAGPPPATSHHGAQHAA